jgi:Laminin B (Domain IV)
VPLSESSWTLMSGGGPVPASRMDMMTVLANVEMLLVRASLGANTRATYLSDVTMEYALDSLVFPGQATAAQVEMCRCPSGYRGSSCEVCVTRNIFNYASNYSCF